MVSGFSGAVLLYRIINLSGFAVTSVLQMIFKRLIKILITVCGLQTHDHSEARVTHPLYPSILLFVHNK